jgi:predicted  nucleic acid-binding Zn-ribbon protein
MKKEDFVPLLEIQSVERKIQNITSSIEKENHRFDQLNSLNQKNEIKIKETKERVEVIINSLEDNEKQLDQLSESLIIKEKEMMKVRTNNELIKIEVEIKKTREQINLLEESMLSLLDEEEQKKGDLDQFNIFNQNFKNSYEEIQKDIEKENYQLFNQKKSLETHLNNLYRDLPKEISDVYVTLKKKHTSPIAFLETNRCGSCKTLIDHLSIKSIESFSAIVLCPTCKKALVATSVQY